MDEQQKKSMWMVLGAIVITFVIAWLIFGNKANTDNEEDIDQGSVRISGDISFNSLKPEQGDEGSIDFKIREHNTGAVFESVDAAITPSLTNGGTWMIDELDANKLYDLKAVLVIEGEEITESHVVTVTAPASDVDLVLTVTWKELPEDSVNASANKTVAGSLNIAGHIPSGSTYTIFTAPVQDLSDADSQVVANGYKFTKQLVGLPAAATNNWEWDDALAKVDYKVQAELYDVNGNYLGSSNNVDAVVPQNDVVLSLESSAITEPTKTPLSGTVTLNGSYKSDSTVSVQVREDGAGGFTEVDSFPAESKRKWVYTDAKTGVEYDVRAKLFRKGEEKATSHQEHTTAPDKGIDLTINTEMSLDDPTSQPVVVSCEDRDDNEYKVTLKYPGVDSARAYWILVGDEKHGNEEHSGKEEPDDDGDDVEVSFHIDEDTYYYTEYAYSYCDDCTTLDSYSEFSPYLKFYCGDKPEND
ncbi:MAG: hypothetical protein ACKUBY_03730 [Candidatus Moraniibacteriota bacterium]|jgi:hypothetical protein